MAGYKETFGANVDYAYGRGVNDVGSRLQRGVQGLQGSGQQIAAFIGQAAAAKRSVKDLGNTLKDLQKELDEATDPKEIARLTKEINNATKAANKFKKELAGVPFNAMEKGLKKVMDGLISFNTSILSMSFNFLIDSIKRVYELQERWTRAIGGFNMKLGGMTKGLQGAQKAATQWSSTIRGLTNGDINEGIQMFGEFTMAMGRTVKAGDKFSKFGVQLARGFGLGGSGAGTVAKVFENIGMSADDSAEAMKTAIKASNQAGIPENMLADDLLKSITYMARFGKEGQKTLIQGAAWARKYDMTLEQLKNTVEGFDAFDDAAQAASKLNTAFGTMINSMDLMMEDVPAKRLDTIRQAMLDQGITYDKLSPKERRYFSETMKLSEEQTAALLDAKNANESYTDFAAKAAAKEKKELSAKALMQKQLQATAQTMYAFGMAFDRVTVAIGNAIKPLLVVLGLAKESDKKFTGFGEVMESITKTVEQFFNSLAKNDKWKDFMKTLANDLLRAGKALKEFVFNGGAAELIGDMAKGMKAFYVMVRDLAIKAVPMLRPMLDALFYLSKYIKEIAIGWGAMKVFNTGRNILGAFGGGGGKGGLMGGLGGKLGMAGAAAGIGGAIGGTGAGVGAGLGSLLGGMFGPMGMVLGPIVGGLAGKAISWIFGSSQVKSALEQAHEDLANTIKEETKKREALNSIMEAATEQQASSDRIRKANNDLLNNMDEKSMKSKTGTITLNEVEADMLRTRAKELTMFGKGTQYSADWLAKLGPGAKISSGTLADLVKSSNDYDIELGKLRAATQKQAELEAAKLQASALGQQKEALEMATKFQKADLDASRAKLKEMGGGTGRMFLGPDGMISDKQLSRDQHVATSDEKLAYFRSMQQKGIKGFDEMIKRAELEAKIDKLDMENVKDQKDLVQKQTEFLKQQTILGLRSAIGQEQGFLNFQNSEAGRGKTIDQQIQDYVNSGQSIVGSNPTVRALLSEGLNFGGTSGVTATPFSGASKVGSGLDFNDTRSPIIIENHVTVDSHLDGQKVGSSKSVQRGLGSSMLQNNNLPGLGG